MEEQHHKQIALWLFACCGMIFLMVVIGGLTRLTGSGLSMVEWAPIMGWIPPLNDTEWVATFQKYQTSPQFRQVNSEMDLVGFKGIFWLEFIHRVIGRLTGVVFLLPLIYFSIRGRVPKSIVPKLVSMFVLGGLQGVLGWYMVKSGLVDQPHVSPYRLTAHLGLAFLLYAMILWTALDLYITHKEGGGSGPSGGLRPLSWAVALMAFTTILSGGFVAGVKAGFHYNTFPLMDGRWFPDNYWFLEPEWVNWFENTAAVQWNHRVLAMVTFLFIVVFWLHSRRVKLPAKVELGFTLLMGMAFIQISLGISTLLLYVPTPLASAHQAGALVLLTLALTVVQLLRLRWRGLPTRSDSQVDGGARA